MFKYSIFEIPYSFFNVMDNYNNNQFTLKIPTAQGIITHDIIMPDGNYSISSFNNFIIQTLIKLGYYYYNSITNVYTTHLLLSASANNYKNYFTFNKIPSTLPTNNSFTNTTSGWGLKGLPTGNTNFITIQFNEYNNIGKLIGFTPKIYPEVVSNVDTIYSFSDQLVNLSVVNTILIKALDVQSSSWVTFSWVG
jgi:hypothetical protein